jgi:hypothetical protein
MVFLDSEALPDDAFGAPEIRERATDVDAYQLNGAKIGWLSDPSQGVALRPFMDARMGYIRVSQRVGVVSGRRARYSAWLPGIFDLCR